MYYDPFQPAVSLAVDEIQRSARPLRPTPHIDGSVEISWITYDTMCVPALGREAGVAFATPGPSKANVVFGCSCSSVSAVVARIGTVLQIPQISWISGAAYLTEKKEEYKYFMRTIASSDPIVCDMMEFFGWRQAKYFFLGSDDELTYDEANYRNDKQLCEPRGIAFFEFKLPSAAVVSTPAAVNGSCSEFGSTFSLSPDGGGCENLALWEDVFLKSRKVLGTVHIINAVSVRGFENLHIAHRQGLLKHPWWIVGFSEMLPSGWDPSEPRNAAMLDALSGAIRQGSDPWATPTDAALRMQEFWETTVTPSRYASRLGTHWQNIVDDAIAVDGRPFNLDDWSVPNWRPMVDAILTIYGAFDKLLGEGHEGSEITGELLYNAMLDQQFEGASGGVKYLESGEIDVASSSVRTVVNLRPDGVWHTVVVFWPNGTASPFRQDDGTFAEVYWAGGLDSVPPDMPPNCLFGQYYDGVDCRGCEAGFGLAAGRECEACEPGRAGNGTCELCIAGRFANATGLTECLECPVGHACGSTGLAGPVPCQPGTFADATGMTGCSACLPGSFAAAEGLSGCRGCAPPGSARPELWTSLRRLPGIEDWVPREGAATQDDCGCRAGTFLLHGDCVPCAVGLKCLGKAEVLLLPGYYAEADNFAEVWECFAEPRRCPGGPLGSCAVGRQPAAGLACTVCELGTKPAGAGACSPCTQADTLPIIGVALGLIVLLCVIYYVALTEDRTTQRRFALLVVLAIGQIFTVYQQMGVLAVIDFSWPSPLAEILRALNVLSFDVNVLPLECIGQISPLGRYCLKVLTVLGLFVWLVLLHAAVSLFRLRRGWKVKHTTFFSSVGVLFMMLLLSIVSALVAPMQCQEHPNGRLTVRKDDGVVCWEGGEHRSMVIVSVLACCMPLSFLAMAFYAVHQLPARLKQGDTEFLSKFFFLFSRFRVDCHWFVLFFMARNFLVAVVPVLPDSTVQWACLMLLLQTSLVMAAYCLPWRVAEANASDMFLTLCLLLLLGVGALLLDSADSTVLGVASTLVVLIIMVCFTGMIGLAVYERCLRRGKPFQCFLCHHKATSGNLARLLKMHLVDHRRVKRKVFVDSDDLSDLNVLFTYVQSEVETLVVLCSREILRRPWCIGEIVTAARNKVATVRVILPNFPELDQKILEDYERLKEMQLLAEYGFTVPMIQEAVERLYGTREVLLPEVLNNVSVKGLVDELLSCSPGDTSDLRQSTLPKAVHHVAASRGIFADSRSTEATCTACIVQKLLTPIVALSLDGDGSGFEILRPDEPLSDAITQIVVVCTNGAFEQLHFVDIALAAMDLGIDLVPIISEVAFRFPTLDFCQALHSTISAMQEVANRADEIVVVVETMFKEIALEVNPQDSEVVLQVRIDTLAQRIAQKGRREKVSLFWDQVEQSAKCSAQLRKYCRRGSGSIRVSTRSNASARVSRKAGSEQLEVTPVASCRFRSEEGFAEDRGEGQDADGRDDRKVTFPAMSETPCSARTKVVSLDDVINEL